MPKTKSIIQRSQNAHERRKLFIEFHTKSRVAEMRMIYEIWKDNDYKALGFDSFGAYCEAPIESGGIDISRAWAIQLAQVYERFKVQLKVPEDELVKLPPRKLYEIRNRVTAENIANMIELVTNTSLEDIRYQDKDMMTCEHETGAFWWSKCKKCGAHIKRKHEEVPEQRKT